MRELVVQTEMFSSGRTGIAEGQKIELKPVEIKPGVRFCDFAILLCSARELNVACTWYYTMSARRGPHPPRNDCRAVNKADTSSTEDCTSHTYR